MNKEEITLKQNTKRSDINSNLDPLGWLEVTRKKRCYIKYELRVIVSKSNTCVLPSPPEEKNIYTK